MLTGRHSDVEGGPWISRSSTFIWGIADDVLRDLYVAASTATSSCR
jgi:hypothetical protein